MTTQTKQQLNLSKMKNQLQKAALTILILMSAKAKAQFTFSDAKYWIGTGTDSTILVVDFHDGTWDTSYAWGYLHGSGATGEDALRAVAAADTNFSIAIGSGFLSDIIYGSHKGIGGSPNYWSTWSGTNLSTMVSNSGISTPIDNGDWFGCSYTDFSPALMPGEPISALNPLYFTKQDIDVWVGSGTDTTILIIDFLDSSSASSYAWGYLHSGSVTAEKMLQDIDSADANLNIVTGSGFLNDITYNSFSGTGGSPNYWGTWSATNLGNWDMNMGLSTVLSNGDIFGCSYTDFSPAVRPGYPVAASIVTAVNDYQQENIYFYPNPANEILNIVLNDTEYQQSSLNIIDVTGRTVLNKTITASVMQVPVHQLSSGFYIIMISGKGNTISKRLIRQ